MEQWEKEFRERAEEAVQEGKYRIPNDIVNKKDYIEYQVLKEKKHRQLLEDEKNGIINNVQSSSNYQIAIKNMEESKRIKEDRRYRRNS